MSFRRPSLQRVLVLAALIAMGLATGACSLGLPSSTPEVGKTIQAAERNGYS